MAMNGWMSEWMNKWILNEYWMNEWMNIEWVNEWMNGWVSEWVSEWMNERDNERTKKELMNERTTNWNYKYILATFAHQDIFSEGNTNKLLKQRNSIYSLRGNNKLILPRPRTDMLRNSFTYRASTLWNNLKDFTTTVSKLVKEQLSL